MQTMPRNTKARGMLSLGCALAMLAGFGGAAKSEAAHDDGRVAIGLHFGEPSYGRPAIDRRWVPGRYEERTIRVLVEPERCERRWVAPCYETRYDHCGRPVRVCVRAGYYTYDTLPARYETRCTRVWVPGYYQDVPVCAPPRRPNFDLSAFFRF